MHVARRAAEDAAPSKQMATWTFSDEVRRRSPRLRSAGTACSPRSQSMHFGVRVGRTANSQNPLVHSTATRAGRAAPHVLHSGSRRTCGRAGPR